MRANLSSIAALAAGGLLLAVAAGTRREASPVMRMRHRAAENLPLGSALAGAAAVAAGAWLLSQQVRRQPDAMHTVEESIEVDVPVSTAYNQWTQFEEFPKFMESVESVEQVDDTHLHWRATVAGKPKEWDAEITEQIPDERIAWRSIDGAPNAGVVTFHKVSDGRTRIMLQMDYSPETMVEKVGGAGGAVKLTAKGNLKRFKELLESRGHETGAWRGTVQQH
jgi:uncharacterized membrane protein